MAVGLAKVMVVVTVELPGGTMLGPAVIFTNAD